MEKRNENGHRHRMRAEYLVSGADGLDDAHLLELLLTYAIPRRDVRRMSYDLINTFGSLERVFDATVPQLTSVDGIGESTAVMIKLVHDINCRVSDERGRAPVCLSDSDDAVRFVCDMLVPCTEEKLAVLALDNKSRLLNSRLFDYGGVNYADADLKSIMEFLILNRASLVVVGHNHPNGYRLPSASDINFTINFRQLLESMKIHLADHIIVGEEGGMSMRSHPEYTGFFNIKVKDFIKE